MTQQRNQTSQTTETAQTPQGKGRSFISDEGLSNAVRDGKQGFTLNVRLTSYRALPLSCIEGMQLKIDGKAVDPQDITFTLNNYSHKLDELPHLSHIWWFILDYAELFVAREQPLAAGTHEVEGTLITVEPYITAGRFSFFSSAKKQLLLQDTI